MHIADKQSNVLSIEIRQINVEQINSCLKAHWTIEVAAILHFTCNPLAQIPLTSIPTGKIGHLQTIRW